MAYIPTQEDLPGIRDLFAFRPETARPLSELVEILLHDKSTLSPGERELIATYVSSQNDCRYCQTIHGATAAAHLNEDEDLVRSVKSDFERAEVSSKLKALLAIVGKVQKSGKQVLPEDVARARAEGATGLEIHDTVLIAAAFCMYNRYADGLGTCAPDAMEWYRDQGRKVADHGYVAALKSYVPEVA
jgi:uncharacterized peroxidase-related enzyme